MAWLDDRAWCHPKLLNLSDQAFRVYINSISYSAGMGTKGRLTAKQQKLIGNNSSTKRRLIGAGLWLSEGSDVLIHDWSLHNQKRDERRAADRLRKRKEREKSAGQSAGRSPGQSPGTSPGQSAGQSAGTARVEGSEGSEKKEPKAVTSTNNNGPGLHEIEELTAASLRSLNA